jgi:hypothetical protein
VSRLSITSRLTFFSRSRFLKSRLIFVEIFIEIVETNRDCWDFWDLSRLFEIYRDISTLSRLFEVLQDQKSWQIEKSWSRNVLKLTNSLSRSRQTVEICQKCHVSTDFSISIETFGTGRWCRDKIDISRSSRLTFWNCQDFLDCQDWLFFLCRDRESRSRPRRDKSRPPTLTFSHFIVADGSLQNVKKTQIF